MTNAEQTKLSECEIAFNGLVDKLKAKGWRMEWDGNHHHICHSPTGEKMFAYNEFPFGDEANGGWAYLIHKVFYEKHPDYVS